MECAERVPSTALEHLEAELCSMAARISAAACEFLMLVAEYDRRRGWESWECRDMAQWLSWKCGISPVTAREQVRVARALDAFPMVRERFRTGRLSYSQVRAIVRSATPETEGALLELAEVSTAAQLERTTRAFRRCRVQEEAMAERRHCGRFLRYGWDDDGNLVGTFSLPAEDGAAFIKAIGDAVPAGRSVEADADGARDPVGAVRADAMVELVSAGARHDVEDDSDSGFLVTVLVGESALAGREGDEGEGACQLENGPGLAPETARRLACDAAVVTVVEDDAGNILDLGRRTRKPNVALRRAMRLRDGHCQFPGCTHRRVQAHHMQHWPAGGRTSLPNLLSVCHFHHRRLHEGGYRLRLDAEGGRHFIHPNGHEFASAPALGPATLNENFYGEIPPYRSGWDGSRLDLPLTVDCLLQHIDPAESHYE